MTYNIELNIKNITVDLAYKLRQIGENNGYKVWKHGYDRLVFESEHGDRFTNLINELSRCCEVHGVDYCKLLDLEEVIY